MTDSRDRVNQSGHVSGTVVCNNCGQKCEKGLFEYHRARCQPFKSKMLEMDRSGMRRFELSTPNRPVGKIPGVVCANCNTRFGAASFKLHQTKCKARSQTDHAEQQTPKPCDMFELRQGWSGFEDMSSSGRDPMGPTYSDADGKKYLGRLMECRNCKRRFPSSRLPAHQLNECVYSTKR